jgi:AhpC/TSA antioxidant enzyme
VQWSRRLPELASNNIRLVLVSVGKPHVAKQLIQHLEFANGEEHLFVDPTNELYDSLDLNRGVQRTFFNANTAFAFLDRFTKTDGTKELGEVLSKWSQGTVASREAFHHCVFLKTPRLISLSYRLYFSGLCSSQSRPGVLAGRNFRVPRVANALRSLRPVDGGPRLDRRSDGRCHDGVGVNANSSAILTSKYSCSLAAFTDTFWLRKHPLSNGNDAALRG